MPSNSDEYKRQVMKDLAGGNKEPLPDETEDYQNFDDVARELFSHLKKRGLSERHLERQLGLSSHNLSKMQPDDVSKLAAFAYHSHPDIFHEVLAIQPALVKFLSNPIVGNTLGAIAAKWFSRK